MTPTEKLKATMAALGISAEGLEFVQRGCYSAARRGVHAVWVRNDYDLFHSAIQIARLFGRER